MSALGRHCPASRNRATRRVIAASAVLALALVIPLAAAPYPAQQASSVSLTSAEECGRCHQDILRYWRASRHAQAADNPRFQAMFGPIKDKDPEPICVRCHAPAAVYSKDPGWEKKVSWEGITCDFCHSVRAVRADSQRPFVVEVGRLKTGPLKNANPTVHAASYSDVYASSTLCAPCHQFTNDRKFDVVTTYAEWQASGYPAKNTTCQTCHMRAVSGKVVDPTVAQTAASTINVHEMPGGHSVVELNRALLAAISAQRTGDKVDVTVQVTNRGAGHRLPTGSPLRAIVMVVEASGGVGRTQTATKTYGRVVADEAGRDLPDEASVFLRAARVVSDTRLAPGEKRVETFSFQIPRSTPTRAVARFYYRYEPDAAGKPQPGVPFLQINTWLAPQ